MSFKHFGTAVRKRFDEMAQGDLFEIECDRDDLWDTYLAAFPEGTNPIYRERTEHDCSCCKSFIRNVAHVVSFDKDGQIVTIWDVSNVPEPYGVVAQAMADRVRSLAVKTIFRTPMGSFGAEVTREMVDGTVKQWHHFSAEIKKPFKTADAATEQSSARATVDVFERGMKELSLDALETVLDLIKQNALYRGEDWKTRLEEFIKHKKRFMKLNSGMAKNRYVWRYYKAACARLKNTAMGTLIADLSSGTDMESAVRKYEAMVAPTNYRRTTALITPKMVKGAVDKLNDMGLAGAVKRRHAHISDVSVNDVLFVDNAAEPHMKDGLTDLLMAETTRKPFDGKRASNISIEDFMANIMPKAKTLDLILTGSNAGNFMTVTAPEEDSGKLFAWDNDFGWAYDGDVADSLKERVRKAGGKVDNVALRVSLGWHNSDDLDLHCHTPGGGHIFFGNKRDVLDVDANAFNIVREPVENMRWVEMPRDGDYVFDVQNYYRRGTADVGFEVEIATRDSTQTYTCAVMPTRDKPCRITVTIKDGTVTVIKTGKALVGGGVAHGEKWGVPYGTPVPVDLMMHSPNYWGTNETGHRHWFFILRDCKNPEKVRGLFTEFLRPELHQHRKVFEVLGAKTMIEPQEKQLSGVGFTAARNDTATVVVNGGAAYNVKF